MPPFFCDDLKLAYQAAREMCYRVYDVHIVSHCVPVYIYGTPTDYPGPEIHTMKLQDAYEHHGIERLIYFNNDAPSRRKRSSTSMPFDCEPISMRALSNLSRFLFASVCARPEQFPLLDSDTRQEAYKLIEGGIRDLVEFERAFLRFIQENDGARLSFVLNLEEAVSPGSKRSPQECDASVTPNLAGLLRKNAVNYVIFVPMPEAFRLSYGI